jgi:hypothetical protein
MLLVASDPTHATHVRQSSRSLRAFLAAVFAAFDKLTTIAAGERPAFAHRSAVGGLRNVFLGFGLANAAAEPVVKLAQLI